jgi:hypothetical protein
MGAPHDRSPSDDRGWRQRIRDLAQQTMAEPTLSDVFTRVPADLLIFDHISYTLRDAEARRGMRTGVVCAAGPNIKAGPMMWA